MRELPILFSAPMVRAILEGRKTMTRRVVKLPAESSLGLWEPTVIGGASTKDRHGNPMPEMTGIWHTRSGRCVAAPWQPGDRLWVRETWQAFRPGSNEPLTGPMKEHPGGIVCTGFEATEAQRCRDFAKAVRYNGRWRPSIHMPRWASRITLEVTGLRVERLQDISQADAISEGICSLGQDWVDRNFAEYAAARDATAPGAKPPLGPTPVERFKALWDSINGLREPKHIRRRRAKGKPVDRLSPAPGPYSWDANPWVWVVEFRRIEQQRIAA